MKSLGEAKKVLGMEIERDRRSGKVRLTQKEYLQKVLQRFNINGDTKSVSTPLVPHFKLKATIFPTTVEEREYLTHVPYASVVGSLMYAMVCKVVIGRGFVQTHFTTMYRRIHFTASQ